MEQNTVYTQSNINRLFIVVYGDVLATVMFFPTLPWKQNHNMSHADTRNKWLFNLTTETAMIYNPCRVLWK